MFWLEAKDKITRGLYEWTNNNTYEQITNDFAPRIKSAKRFSVTALLYKRAVTRVRFRSDAEIIMAANDNGFSPYGVTSLMAELPLAGVE